VAGRWDGGSAVVEKGVAACEKVSGDNYLIINTLCKPHLEVSKKL
jgi:hypothetical protein